MKIVLCAINAKYIHSNLAVYSLKAYGGMDDILQIKEYTINNETENILDDLYMENADVIAFSCYIWNIGVVKVLAKELKKVSPDLMIWAGGPEVSYDSRISIETENCFDLIMKGEGEKTFSQLCKAKLNAKNSSQFFELAKDIGGVCYKNVEGEVVETEFPSLLSMDEIPFVYGDLSGFENKILYYETARGCPFRCSYCLSSIDKRVRLRSLELVKKELQFFLDSKVPQVKFIDRTFNVDKNHSRAIWTYILEHDNQVTNFHFEISADLLEEEDIRILTAMRPGLVQLEIGMQTTNPFTIKEIRRTMDLDRLKEAMNKLSVSANMHLHLDLIAGLPYENFDSFKKSFDDAYAMGASNLQLGFLKVLKGSYMANQVKEYELVFRDEPPYEVLKTKWISFDEIIRLKQVENVLEIYGNSGQFKYSLKYLLSFFHSPFDFYDKLGQFFTATGRDKISQKRVDRYIGLLDFAAWLKNDENYGHIDKAVLIELLTIDLYARENLKSRPNFAANLEPYKKSFTNFYIAGGSDDYVLSGKNYDSKVMARKTHIEPIHVDIQNINEDMTCSEDVTYLFFDYEYRNPIDYNCRINHFLSLNKN